MTMPASAHAHMMQIHARYRHKTVSPAARASCIYSWPCLPYCACVQIHTRHRHNNISAAAQASPIVRVAVEPARPTDLAQLEQGLQLLNRADPFVEVTTLDSGEHVIGAAGASQPRMQAWDFLVRNRWRRPGKCRGHVTGAAGASQPLMQTQDPILHQTGGGIQTV